jgi:hypothetical protein
LESEEGGVVPRKIAEKYPPGSASEGTEIEKSIFLVSPELTVTSLGAFIQEARPVWPATNCGLPVSPMASKFSNVV